MSADNGIVMRFDAVRLGMTFFGEWLRKGKGHRKRVLWQTASQLLG